jgi:hypothetical protein
MPEHPEPASGLLPPDGLPVDTSSKFRKNFSAYHFLIAKRHELVYIQ